MCTCICSSINTYAHAQTCTYTHIQTHSTCLGANAGQGKENNIHVSITHRFFAFDKFKVDKVPT